MTIHKRYAVVFFVFALLFAVAAATYVSAPTIPESSSVETTVSATISIDGILPSETRSLTEDTSALQLLQDVTAAHGIVVATKNYPGMGTLVEKIDTLENGAEEKYWTYYVNGAFAPVGADAYIVTSGDRIEWKFEVPEEI